MDYPRRIVCLTEETTEALYLLGEQERIVGISGYTCRPPIARREKPKVSAYLNANYEKIAALAPDLVLAFSDLQAEIAAELARRGFNVVLFNQRGVEDIFAMLLTLARLVGAEARGRELIARLRGGLQAIAASAARFARRPRVFFEEWPDPLIAGIQWVEELIAMAGGEPVFAAGPAHAAAKARIVSADEVLGLRPEVVIASWCGRKVNKEKIRARPGWGDLPVFEVKSTYILQPGPAALTEGVRQLHAILARVAGATVAPELAPAERCDAAGA